MARSHCSVRSSPQPTRSAVTMAWKELLVGAQATRPFQRGSVKPHRSSGRSASVNASVPYTTTRARPVMPTQVPSLDRAHSGVIAMMSSGSATIISETAASPPGSWA